MCLSLCLCSSLLRSFFLFLFSSLISLLSSPILDSQGGSGAKRPSFFCCSCTSQWWHPSVSTSLPPTCYSPVPCSELVGSLTPPTLSSSMCERWTTHCSVRSVLEHELCTACRHFSCSVAASAAGFHMHVSWITTLQSLEYPKIPHL